MLAHPGSAQGVAAELRRATAANAWVENAWVGNAMVVFVFAGREETMRDPTEPETQNAAPSETDRLEASTVRAVEPHPVDHRRGGWPHDRHHGCRCGE